MGRQPGVGLFLEPHTAQRPQAEWLSTEHPVPLSPQISPMGTDTVLSLFSKEGTPFSPSFLNSAS